MKKTETLRELTGITRQELAQALEVSLRQLLNFEKDKEVLPEQSQMLLTTLSRYLDALHRKYHSFWMDDKLPPTEKLEEAIFRNRKAQVLLLQKAAVAKNKFLEMRREFYTIYRSSIDARDLKRIIILASEKGVQGKLSDGYRLQSRLLKYEEQLMTQSLEFAKLRDKGAA